VQVNDLPLALHSAQHDRPSVEDAGAFVHAIVQMKRGDGDVP
jgi:hypothetical protein